MPGSDASKKMKTRGFGRKLGTYFLVGVFNPSEKYDFVSWDDDIPN